MKKTDIRFSMYAFIIAFSLSFFLSSCNSDPSKKVKSENLQAVEERSSNDANAPEITFEKDVIEYGNVFEGQVVEEVFKFTNTGSSNLIISDAQASCGCTVPNYPKGENIAPGEGGEITVRFNTDGRVGPGMKTVTLTTNTNAIKKIIRINGKVLKR